MSKAHTYDLPVDYKPGKRGRPGSATSEREGYRVCQECYVMKALTEFHRRGNGYQSLCKPCQIEKVKNSVNPDRVKQYAREYMYAHREERARYRMWWRAHNEEKAKQMEHESYLRRKAKSVG